MADLLPLMDSSIIQLPSVLIPRFLCPWEHRRQGERNAASFGVTCGFDGLTQVLFSL